MNAKSQLDWALIAHLLRRAGFGPTYEELESFAAKGYEAAVEELLHPEGRPEMEEDLMLRLNAQWTQFSSNVGARSYWTYRMINSQRPLEEKMALFWHGVLCTGNTKVDWPRQMVTTITKYRQLGLGNFRDLLLEVAGDPAMVYYLDNCMSHNGAINENWGRELLELFSMGVGNYTEDDVKEASRAFTGWTNAPTTPVYPNGRVDWQFLYDPTDHDDKMKTFLGQTGNLNGEDVVDIICQQAATARFIGRHMYSFFVADDVPVAQWANTPPRDPEVIDALVRAYFDSHYDIRSMLRVLFNSPSFKNARFTKVKSPVEVVVGTMRLIKEYPIHKPGFIDVVMECEYMGQAVLDPPTVEGWHTGAEWIDTGTLVGRINFVSKHLGDTNKPGVQQIIGRLRVQGDTVSPQEFVDRCVEQLGLVRLDPQSRDDLIEHARRGGSLWADSAEFPRRVAEMLQLIAATKEYQFC